MVRFLLSRRVLKLKLRAVAPRVLLNRSMVLSTVPSNTAYYFFAVTLPARENNRKTMDNNRVVAFVTQALTQVQAKARKI